MKYRIFEKVSEKIPADFALPWITIELLRILNYNKKTLDEVSIKSEHFIELLELVKNKKITELNAKRILNDFIPSSFSPKKIASSSGRIIDKKELEKIIDKVLQNNKKAIQDYKSGKRESLNFLMGEIMKESDKRADFKLSLEILKKKISLIFSQ